MKRFYYPFFELKALVELFILAVLQLYLLMHVRPLDLHLEDVCLIPFPKGYLLLTFAIYKEYMVPVEHKEYQNPIRSRDQ